MKNKQTQLRFLVCPLPLQSLLQEEDQRTPTLPFTHRARQCYTIRTLQWMFCYQELPHHILSLQFQVSYHYKFLNGLASEEKGRISGQTSLLLVAQGSLC